MTERPGLIGANGAPLSRAQLDRAPEVERLQPHPFPHLAGLLAVRVRAERHSAPEAWRVSFAMRTTVEGGGKSFNLDMPKGLCGRQLAKMLREAGSAMDALCDQLEKAANDQITEGREAAQVHPAIARTLATWWRTIRERGNRIIHAGLHRLRGHRS